eukprot:SAG31_NODE_37895_length_300_cov_1.034826_1_plen_46_part_10
MDQHGRTWVATAELPRKCFHYAVDGLCFARQSKRGEKQSHRIIKSQ